MQRQVGAEYPAMWILPRHAKTLGAQGADCWPQEKKAKNPWIFLHWQGGGRERANSFRFMHPLKISPGQAHWDIHKENLINAHTSQDDWEDSVCGPIRHQISTGVCVGRFKPKIDTKREAVCPSEVLLHFVSLYRCMEGIYWLVALRPGSIT